MFQKLQRFNVLIGLVLGVAIASLMLLAPQGLGRLGIFAVAAGVFCLCAFVWKPKPPTTLNSFGLPLLLVGHVPTGYLLAAIGLLVLAYVAKAAVDILTHQEGNNIFEAWGGPGSTHAPAGSASTRTTTPATCGPASG